MKPFIPSHFIDKICVMLGFKPEDNPKETKMYCKFRDVCVLLCEDYRMNQDVAVGMLAQFGVEATVAENGREGIELLNSGKAFDLIFMDLHMPIMDGYDATRIIRADSRFDAVPVIGLTADAMKETVDDCYKIGMNDHLAKPIEYSSLYKTLQKWLPESKRVADSEVNIPADDPLREALSRFAGDEDRYRTALLEFSQMLPDEWQDFDSAVENIDKTKGFIHKLKGSAGTLSEKDVYQCAVQFEDSLRSGKPDEDIYNQLVSICCAVKTRIIEQADESSDVTLDAGTAEDLKELLAVLKNALQGYEPEAIDTVVKSFRSKVWPQIDGQKLKQLYTLTASFEYSVALDVIDEIIGEAFYV